MGSRLKYCPNDKKVAKIIGVVHTGLEFESAGKETAKHADSCWKRGTGGIAGGCTHPLWCTRLMGRKTVRPIQSYPTS